MLAPPPPAAVRPDRALQVGSRRMKIGRIEGKNSFGRPLFQNLSYSDTPAQPLAPMQFKDANAAAGTAHKYRVIAVNTVGLRAKSKEVGE